MRIFSASFVVPVTHPPIEGGAVAVEGGRIVAVGRRNEIVASHRGRVSDFPGCIVTPGLVNAHTHLLLTHFPAWKIRKGLDYLPRTYTDWVIQVIKIVRGLSREEKEASLSEGLEKSLAAGSTTIGEVVIDPPLLPLYDATPQGGRLYLEAIGVDDGKVDGIVHRIDRLLGEWPHRMLPGISPHTPHTVSPRLFTELTRLGRSRQVPLMTHLAEAPEELRFHHDSTGPFTDLLYPFVGWTDFIPPPRRQTPVSFLESLGVLGPWLSAVHAVQVTPHDAGILRRYGVPVIVSPRSNDRLTVGRVPLPLFRKLGITIGIGTDSIASSDSLSLWDELRFLQDSFPGLFTPEEAFSLATMGSARAIGMEESVGSLEPGKRADLLVVSPHRTPSAASLFDTLLEGYRELKVIVGGEDT